MPDIYSKKVTRWFFGGKGYPNRKGACKAKAIKIIKTQLRTIANDRYGSSCECCGGTGLENPILGVGQCVVCNGGGVDQEYHVADIDIPSDGGGW